MLCESSSSSSSSSLLAVKKHWWFTNKKLAEKYLTTAHVLLGNQEPNEICSALNLVEAALDLLPNWEKALELKARALLYLRRFKDVANMLQEYIPSVKFREDICPSESSPLSREKVKLLPSYGEDERLRARVLLKCFSVSKLKKKMFAGKSEREEWRYLVLGQACCHLGLMEDAMLLLQSGKRVACAAFRKASTYSSHDSFESCGSESQVVKHLLGNIKLLLRRKMAALAALDAGLYLEAARHLSKIVDGKRGTPQGFIAECYLLRATTYQADGRLADSIADCNRTLALDPTCMEALTTRASLFETVRCFSESLQDLEHLKLLHETILHHHKLPGSNSIWKHTNVNFSNIHGNLQYLNSKIHTIKQSLSNPYTIDYHTLIGLRRGCTMADVERAHLLLCLRHRPDKASHFVDRCEFVDERDIHLVKDQARVSAFMLYRLLQKAYTYIMTCIMEDEAHKDTNQSSLHIHAKKANFKQGDSSIGNEDNIDFSNTQGKEFDSELQQVLLATSDASMYTTITCANGESKASVFQAVSCRDLAAVGTILSHSFQGHSLRPLPLSYEALSC